VTAKPPLAGFAALACMLVALWLAWHYPIAFPLAIVVLLAWAAFNFKRPAAWLIVLPAVLPVVGFAPWTGWLVVEEIDILALGVAAGGYAALWRRAQDESPRAPVERAARGRSGTWIALIALFALWNAVTVARGIAASGSSAGGWFDGYYDALNSVRVGKGFFVALLLLPLALDQLRQSARRATALLTAGMALGACAAAVAVVWERAAFTGLLDFSADYRATGLFWEMHVGGAALDGFLLLTIPFVVALLLSAAGRIQVGAAISALLLVSYACLATFSRGVYLAVPVSLALLLILLIAQSRQDLRATALAQVTNGVLLTAVMAVVSVLAFRHGGYRALLAVLAVFVISLSLRVAMRGATWRDWAKGIAIGGMLGAICGVVAPHVFKGPYFVFAGVFAACCWRASRPMHQTDNSRTFALSAYVWLVIAAALVALQWGGAPALHDSSIALLLVQGLAAWSARSKQALWGDNLRARGLLTGSAIAVAGAVAVFSGGAYMGERFASVEQDFAGRTNHWRESIGLLRSTGEWIAGKGAGRFPEAYYQAASDSVFPGSYRRGFTDGNAVLTLAGPRYPTSFGDLFRIAQRVSAAPGAYLASFDVRAESNVQIHIEVCEQHLLYNGGCALAAPGIEATGNSWRRIVVPLDGRDLSGGPWYAPRLAFFALAVASSGRWVDLDNVSLLGPDGDELVANGGFDDGTAHWFAISERHHLPWHAKNLALNVLIDQGVVGVLLFGLLAGGALGRLIWGGARAHPLAPYLAASLAGFLTVGVFDSLLDVPRVALLFYLLVLLTLVLPEAFGRTRRSSQTCASQ
jgi:hypothetical protein